MSLDVHWTTWSNCKQVDVVKTWDTLPDDVHIYRTDEPRVVSDSVYSFLKDMLISVLAVIAVMMIMLPVRVASVAATSIPITIFISIECSMCWDLKLTRYISFCW